MPLQTPDAAALADYIHFCASSASRPYFVAIDGRSGVGKSTLSLAVGNALGAAVIEGDDFFAGGMGMRSDRLCLRAADCIDWTLVSAPYWRLCDKAATPHGGLLIGMRSTDDCSRA